MVFERFKFGKLTANSQDHSVGRQSIEGLRNKAMLPLRPFILSAFCSFEKPHTNLFGHHADRQQKIFKISELDQCLQKRQKFIL